MSAREPKVFVTQVPSRRDKATKLWVPTVNIQPAQQYGELVIMLPPGSQFYATQQVKNLIKERLHEMDFQEEDYLLPMGSPQIMAIAAAICARRANGRLNLLAWDTHSNVYNAYKIENLF